MTCYGDTALRNDVAAVFLGRLHVFRNVTCVSGGDINLGPALYLVLSGADFSLFGLVFRHHFCHDGSLGGVAVS